MIDQLTLAEKARNIWLYLVFRTGHPVTPSLSDLISVTGIPLEDVNPALDLINKYCQSRNYPPIGVLLHSPDKYLSLPFHVWMFSFQYINDYGWRSFPPAETRSFNALIPVDKRRIRLPHPKYANNSDSRTLMDLDRTEQELTELTLSLWQYLVIWASSRVGQLNYTLMEKFSDIPREYYQEPLDLIGTYCFSHYLPPLDELLTDDFDEIIIDHRVSGRLVRQLWTYPWLSIRHPDRIDFVPYLKKPQS